MNKSLYLPLLSICALSTAAEAETAKPQVKQLERFAPYQQISGMKGYDLRARKIVVPPGGAIPEHGHKTRPGIVYVQSGEIVEYRGDVSVVLKAGDSVIEDFTTVHAYKNVSDTACVLIAFDVPVTQID